ncbi:hypothetical protein PR202_gb06436 [Eleusine coracana subsp. coracana]|uniref:S-acyltransferase n=1 Tax=Eleusine coracana subsp. coracana TaxID=191504 RepID=A0AAV5E9E5_ELECO|nr:hypothetical protein PR202_gb06436 [Eleusine coracana subsp. coracana]
MASSEIEVVGDAAAISPPAGCGAAPAAAAGVEQEGQEEPLKDDVYTGAAYGDLEKLHRLRRARGPLRDGARRAGGTTRFQWAGRAQQPRRRRRPVHPRGRFPTPKSPTLRRSLASICLAVDNHGADVNATDHTGQTALHWSAVRGHIQVAELLLKEGAKVDAADLYGYQENARRVHERGCGGNSYFGKISKFGLAPLFWKDPGYISKNIRDSQNQRDDEPLLKRGLDNPELLSGNWSQLCITCKRNKWEFFMFLILEVSAMVITGATAIIRSIGDPACPGSFGGWLTYTAINHSWVVSFVIMDSFLFFGVITLTVIQASQISSNITTNEMANALRYSYLRGPGGRFRNPFDHGVRKNCSDFFLKGYNEDIEKAEPTVRPDEEMGTIQMTRSTISQNGESIPLHVNGTDHGCADSQANSKSHRPHSPSKDCNHNKKSDKTPLGLGLGLGRNNPSSRYVRSLLPL